MKSSILLLTILLLGTQVKAQKEKSVNDVKGLQIGANAPVFSAIDADSNIFNLSEALKTGPVVVIFYRGFWCSYCNKHLATIQDSLSLITDKGAAVVAVSPEKPEYLERMAEKQGTSFKLLYDEGYKISDAYDVTFTPESRQLFVYNTVLNGDLKESHSDDSQRLPIPATYIIDKEGVISWRQFNPNYKKRSTVKDILEHLPQ